MKGNLTESSRLLREDDGNSPKMALELRTDPRENLVRLRRVHPLSWRTVMAVLEYTDIVHKAVLCEGAVN